MDQATVDRLRAHDWGAEPFERSPGGTAGEPYRIRLVDERCFFLDPDNRCRIHSEIGYAAKPTVCRSFPLTVLDVAGKRYARLSFWCPTVSDNIGKPLEQQTRWVRDTAKYADQRTAPLTINDQAPLTDRDFERIHHALRRLLGAASLSVADRLAAASAVVRRLDTNSARSDFLVEREVQDAEAAGTSTLVQEGRDTGDAAAGRRALMLYLLQDCRPGRIATLGRLAAVVLYSVGISPLASRAVSARASRRQLRRVSLTPSPELDAILLRYFFMKFDSRRYVAGDATLVTGFNLLVAAYGVIDVLARMHAWSAGRIVCEEEDVRRAVSAADLLVVEHTGLYQGNLHRQLTRAALGTSLLCGGMLAQLEPAP